MFLTHREIKMKITTPIVKTTHVPTIIPTVKDVLFDGELRKPVDGVQLSRKIKYLHYLSQNVKITVTYVAII